MRIILTRVLVLATNLAFIVFGTNWKYIDACKHDYITYGIIGNASRSGWGGFWGNLCAINIFLLVVYI